MPRPSSRPGSRLAVPLVPALVLSVATVCGCSSTPRLPERPSAAEQIDQIAKRRAEAVRLSQEAERISATNPELAIETYRRAEIESCRMAIVLSPDYGNGSSDAIVAAAVSVIDRVGPDIYIVAECLEESHRALFDSCNCNAVVLGMAIAGNLLVQEVHDPGIAQLVEVVSSNRRGTTLFCIDVIEDAVPYTPLAKGLLDHSINVMAVNRGTESLTVLTGLESQIGDRLVYSASQRLDWTTLRGRVGS
jgi:hypothetical protein